MTVSISFGPIPPPVAYRIFTGAARTEDTHGATAMPPAATAPARMRSRRDSFGLVNFENPSRMGSSIICADARCHRMQDLRCKISAKQAQYSRFRCKVTPLKVCKHDDDTH